MSDETKPELKKLDSNELQQILQESLKEFKEDHDFYDNCPCCSGGLTLIPLFLSLFIILVVCLYGLYVFSRNVYFHLFEKQCPLKRHPGFIIYEDY